MKYAEYEKLRLVLEQNGKTINDLITEDAGMSLPINEEGPQPLDTSGSKRSFAEFAKNPFLKKKLTTAAEKLQNMVHEKIVNVHYQAIIQDSQKVFDEITKLKKEGKTDQQVLDDLGPNIKTVQTAMNTRYKNLDQSMRKLMDNSTTKVNAMLAKKNLNDNARMNMENYWTLLTTQVFQNAWSEIVKKETEYINKNMKENEKLATAVLNVRGAQEHQNAAQENVQEATNNLNNAPQENTEQPEQQQPEQQQPEQQQPEQQPANPPAAETESDPNKIRDELGPPPENQQPTETTTVGAQPQAQPQQQPEQPQAQPQQQPEQPQAQPQQQPEQQPAGLTIDTLKQGNRYVYTDANGKKFNVDYRGKGTKGNAMVFIEGGEETDPKNLIPVPADKVGQMLSEPRKGGTTADDLGSGKGSGSSSNKYRQGQEKKMASNLGDSLNAPEGFKMVAENLQDFLK